MSNAHPRTLSSYPIQVADKSCPALAAKLYGLWGHTLGLLSTGWQHQDRWDSDGRILVHVSVHPVYGQMLKLGASSVRPGPLV